MKKILWGILLLPSLAFADRLGSLTPNSNVLLSTQSAVGGSALTVTTGTSTGYTSPPTTTAATAIIFDSSTFNSTLAGGTSVYVSLASNSSSMNKLNRTLFSMTTSSTVSNTTAETNIIASGTGTVILPANYLNSGDTIRVKASGLYTSTTSAGTISLKFKLGSTVIVSTTVITLVDNQTNQLWLFGVAVAVRSSGSSGTVFANTDCGFYDTTNGMRVFPMTNTTASTIDTTQAQQVVLTVQFSTASVNNIFTNTNFFIVGETTTALSSGGGGGGGSGDITDVTAGYGISVANSTGPDPIVSLVTNSTSYIQNRTSAQSSATAFPDYLQVGSSATFHGENLFNTNSGDEVQKFFVRDAADPSNNVYIPYLFRDQDGSDNYYADFSVTSSSVSDGGNTGWGEITWGIMNLGTIGNRLHLKGSASGVFLGLAGEMRYYDVTGFNNEYVALASSPTVPSSYKIVMPNAPGTAGQVRSIVNVDGSTVYEAYSTPAAGGGGSAITIATGSASGYSGTFTSAASGVVFDSTTFSGKSLAGGTSVYVYANAISTGTGRVKTSKMSFSYTLQPFSAKVISPGATSYPKIDMATTSAVSSIFWDSISTQTVSYATVLAPYSGGNFNIDFNFSGSSITTGNVNWGAFVSCAGQGKATSVDSLFSSYSIQASTAGAIPGTAGYVYCLTIRGLSNNGCSEGDVMGVLVTRNHNVSSDAVGDIRLFSSRIYED